MAEQTDGDRPRGVPVRPEGLDQLPILFANQFIVQRHQDGVILVIAQVAPPVLLGTREEQERALRELESVGSRPLLRVALTEERARELGRLLLGEPAQETSEDEE